jgi:hypothetical protein
VSTDKFPLRVIPDKVASLASKGGGDYVFNAAKKTWLDVFAKTLDKAKAFEESGLDPRALSRCPYMKNEIAMINQAAMYSSRSKVSLGTHHRIMAKVETTMDDSTDARTKASYANVLARMSGDALRAAGEMNPDVSLQNNQAIQVVLNMGSPSVE